MAIPIFVVGNNRSGTKWLSNILINHPQISGIQSEYHRGILETNVFSQFPRTFGDLSSIENFIGFVECFAATDFFKISGLDKSLLYRMKTDNYFEFFRKLMDSYADRQKTRFWLQKIHAFNFHKVYENFPDAVFIFISRGIRETTQSAYVLEKRLGQSPSIIRQVLIYVYSQKILKRNRKRRNVMATTYEALREDTAKVIEATCEFLGVDYLPEILQVSFRKNTSYGKVKEREKAVLFPHRYIFVVRLLYQIFKPIPKFLFDVLFKMKTFTSQHRRSFVPGTFAMICDEHGFKKIEY